MSPSLTVDVTRPQTTNPSPSPLCPESRCANDGTDPFYLNSEGKCAECTAANCATRRWERKFMMAGGCRADGFCKKCAKASSGPLLLSRSFDSCLSMAAAVQVQRHGRSKDLRQGVCNSLHGCHCLRPS